MIWNMLQENDNKTSINDTLFWKPYSDAFLNSLIPNRLMPSEVFIRLPRVDAKVFSIWIRGLMNCDGV